MEGAEEAGLEVEGAATEQTIEVEAEAEVISDVVAEGARETKRPAIELVIAIGIPFSMLSSTISPSSLSMVNKLSKPELSGSARARHSSTAICCRALV